MKDKLIAITGGIGSGKSEALKILKDCGYNVLSCDDFTPLAYADREIKRFLINTFGTDKKEGIKKIAFTDPIKYGELKAVVTEKVFELTIERALKTGGTVFVEVPLLFECGYQDAFDKVIIIKRNLSDRITAVMRRSALTKEEVEKRIAAQFDYDNNDLSDYIIVSNDKSLDDLKRSLETEVKKIIQP